MADQSQSNLISALKQRDRAAWNLAVDRHSREVYGFVFHLVGSDRAAAEDLTQETWLAAVDGINGCDADKGSFRNWLFGIARKRVIIYYRHRASVGELGSLHDRSGDVAESEDASILPADVLEQVEQNAVVRAALLVLADDRRQMVLAKYVEGLSVQQIAARTGRTAKAVESLLSRTREQLRSQLRRYVTTCSDSRSAKRDS